MKHLTFTAISTKNIIKFNTEDEYWAFMENPGLNYIIEVPNIYQQKLLFGEDTLSHIKPLVIQGMSVYGYVLNTPKNIKKTQTLEVSMFWDLFDRVTVETLKESSSPHPLMLAFFEKMRKQIIMGPTVAQTLHEGFSTHEDIVLSATSGMPALSNIYTRILNWLKFVSDKNCLLFSTWGF